MVTRDVPDNVVAAGSPCRVVRSVTKEDLLREYRFPGLDTPAEGHPEEKMAFSEKTS